jgi:hypothetical protein
MASDNGNRSLLPREGKIYTVLLGAFIILLTTTVPYLTLLNVFLFAGIFLAGAVSLNRSILHFHVRLPYSEAFFWGCVTGLVGGILSEGVAFLLIETLHYRPGVESLSIVINWAVQIAKGKPELQDQVQALIAAQKLVLLPVKLTFKEILMNMVFSGAFYAPISGLGGAYAVLRLKRQAKRG